MICVNYIFKKFWKLFNQLNGDNILFVMDFSVISKSYFVSFKIFNKLKFYNFVFYYYFYIFKVCQENIVF